MSQDEYITSGELVIKQSLLLSILSVFQLGVALIFQLFILRIFNIGISLDLYFASNTINSIIVVVATASLNRAMTPIFIKYSTRNRYRSLRELANSLFNTFLVIFLILAVTQAVFATQITSAMFPGFTGEDNKLLSELFAIQAFISIVSMLIGVLNSLNYTFNNLYRTIAIPICASFLQIVFVYYTHQQLGILSLVYALGINQVIIFICLGAPFVKYYSFTIKFSRQFKDAAGKMLPLTATFLISKSDIIVDRYFASVLVSGSISLLRYGLLFISTLSTVVNNGVSLVSLRKFSKIERDKESFNKYFLSLYKMMLIVTMFFVIGTVLCGDFVIQLLLGKNMSADSLNSLYYVTLAYIGVFIGKTLSSVLVNAFYAKGLTAVVSKLNISLHLLGIATKIVGFKLFGFFALPIVMSLKNLIISAALLFLYNRCVAKIALFPVLISTLKVTFVSCLLLAGGIFLKKYGVHAVAAAFIILLTYTAVFYRYVIGEYRKNMQIKHGS